MPFVPSDHYLPSGTSTLKNSWVDPVYKFDSSSFYNWEQDNLPVYDLEDRDNLLYEMAGYPLSSVTGMMLCVSDCGIDNKKVFGTISDAIDALPNTIRFPIIIEVAASGNLGDLILQDKVFEGSSAGLEIINRGFAKALCGSGAAGDWTESSYIDSVNGGTYVSSITTVKSVDLSNTMVESSAICVSSSVWASVPDAKYYWDNYVRAFFLTPEYSNTGGGEGKTHSVSTFFKDIYGGVEFSSATEAVYTMGTPDDAGTPGGLGECTDNSVSSDMVPINSTSYLFKPDNYIRRTPISYGIDNRATGLVYANSLSSVIVNNCNGPIYIRGFCAYGANMAALTNAASEQIPNIGFDIQNSDVVIENCVATRYKGCGLQAVNSNVILNRGFIAFRNYELSTVSAHLDSKVFTNPTAGLRATNSNIILSSTTASATGLPVDSPFCFYRNMIGIELKNSTLGTPQIFKYGTNIDAVEVPSTYGSESLVFQSFLNLKSGIQAINSTIDTSQRMAVFSNELGLDLDNSVVRVGQFTIDHNQKAGVLASNSEFNYNKDAIKTGYTGGPFFPVYNFKANGQDIVADNSRFVPTYTSAMDDKYEGFQLSGNHQCDIRNIGGSNELKSTLPSVALTNGSYMDGIAVNSVNSTFTKDTTEYEAAEGIRGCAFSVTDQSTLRLVGHKDVATHILGPYDWLKQQRVAGLYAGNNSKIYIAGPTVIAQCGIDALAEDNSVVEVAPAETDGILDVSSFSLANVANHTTVQLHSTRACLVANRNSAINMHDMGDYHAHWAPKYFYNKNLDYPTGDGTAQGAGQSLYGTSAYTSGGYVQFYPNPYTEYGTTLGSELNLESQAVLPMSRFASTPAAYVKLTNFNHDVSNASWGGMCVRAVGESTVNVKNVMFPAGYANPSGAYYDASTLGGCDLLRIWNIADHSELHASYLSVSSFHPQDISGTYYGPSAVWVSGGSPNWVTLSACPSSTPDTSSLSILDAFGYGVDTKNYLGFYGKSTWENIGPFRIYVSPAPEAKLLGYVSGAEGYYNPYDASAGGGAATGGNGTGNGATFTSLGFNWPVSGNLVVGAPYQLFAQGYSPSSDCSATNDQGPNFTNPSSIYPELGGSGYYMDSLTTPRIPAANPEHLENTASSFYYAKDMIPGDPASRIWLDESAMNTFANAKNGTLNRSNRKKIFSYYKTTTDYPGEGFWKANSGFGVGFRSANIFDIDRKV